MRTALLAALCLTAAATPALALTSSECSAKYQAAKQAGTLGGLRWNEFRRAECGAGQTSTTVRNPLDAGGSPPTVAPVPAPTKAPVAPKPFGASGSNYPSAVDPKYASESPGKARMHTCLDGYHASKASGVGATMPWIVKGGGYYSECNRRLKGAA